MIEFYYVGLETDLTDDFICHEGPDEALTTLKEYQSEGDERSKIYKVTIIEVDDAPTQ